MKDPIQDPVERMDEIVKQLDALYTEAAALIDPYVERVCTNAGIPRDIIRNHARKRTHDLRPASG
jgi:hypothetical protein